ncbi:hypothetical protein [Streptomyces eurythermus]|uniref:hypothetical protein n=1 Tax=Streptomyces eurythermus TaxID=42237 RepID=UPI0036D40758
MNTLRSTLMAAAGIVQEGDVLLQTVAQPFDLPTEADEARHVVRELNAAISRVKELHDFGKGMGIAAPQIGIGRAVAAIVPPGDGSTPGVDPSPGGTMAATARPMPICGAAMPMPLPKSWSSLTREMAALSSRTTWRASSASVGRSKGWATVWRRTSPSWTMPAAAMRVLRRVFTGSLS